MQQTLHPHHKKDAQRHRLNVYAIKGKKMRLGYNYHYSEVITYNTFRSRSEAGLSIDKIRPNLMHIPSQKAMQIIVH
jgi:hypothetical protein